MEMRRRWEPSGWPSERAARELPSNAFSERCGGHDQVMASGDTTC